MAALAALSGAALASDSVLRGASDVIDKRVIPRVVNSLATRLGDAGDWNSVAGDRVRVGPRAVVKLPYVVQGNDVLRWEFCVRAHDVRFSVSERRMASGGAVEVGLLPSATFAAGSKFGGAWTAETRTTLLLVFDNAYSLVTAKDVAVAVSVRSATYRPAEESLSAMAEYRKGGASSIRTAGAIDDCVLMTPKHVQQNDPASSASASSPRAQALSIRRGRRRGYSDQSAPLLVGDRPCGTRLPLRAGRAASACAHASWGFYRPLGRPRAARLSSCNASFWPPPAPAYLEPGTVTTESPRRPRGCARRRSCASLQPRVLRGRRDHAPHLRLGATTGRAAAGRTSRCGRTAFQTRRRSRPCRPTQVPGDLVRVQRRRASARSRRRTAARNASMSESFDRTRE